MTLICALRVLCGFPSSLPVFLGLEISSSRVSAGENRAESASPCGRWVVGGSAGRGGRRSPLPAAGRHGRRETAMEGGDAAGGGAACLALCGPVRHRAPQCGRRAPCPGALGAPDVQALSGPRPSQWCTPLTAVPTQGDREGVPALSTGRERGTGCYGVLCPPPRAGACPRKGPSPRAATVLL